MDSNSQPSGGQTEPVVHDPRSSAVLNSQYKILSIVGQGNVAIVFKAKQLSTQRIVAVKTLINSTGQADKRFENEIRAHSRLRHRNIVEAFDCLTDERTGQVFFIMEYLEGKTLQELIRQRHELLRDEESIYSIMSQICDALSHAHDAGILHRDLKPLNVLVVEQEGNCCAKVLDFGIARAQEDLQRLTKPGTVVGSPLYMSPEQCKGDDIDQRSEVYSLGALFYEMITGALAYDEPTLVKVMAAHCDKERMPEPIATHNQYIRGSKQLDKIIHTAMAVSKENRFPSVAQLKEALQFWITSIRKNQPDAVLPIAQFLSPRNTSSKMNPIPSSMTNTDRRALDNLVSSSLASPVQSEKFSYRGTGQFPSTATSAAVELDQLTPGEPLIGKRIDKYKIHEVLGQGAMAIVYKAENTTSGEIVALKSLKFSEGDLSSRFAREVKIHEGLRHQNIVRPIECLQLPSGQSFFVMELLKGTNLDEYIEKEGRVEDVRDIASIISQICNALEYAHRKGIIHRDIKPENILISKENKEPKIKVLDFGIAKLQEDLQRLTKTGIVLGSPAYMSPEQCYGEPLGVTSDLYSFGVLIFEMMTGEFPYEAENEREMMEAHCEPGILPLSLSEIRSDVPGVERLDAIVKKMLSVEIIDRFPSVVDLKLELNEWWKEAFEETEEEVSPFRVRKPKPQRRPASEAKGASDEDLAELGKLVENKLSKKRSDLAEQFNTNTHKGPRGKSNTGLLVIASIAILVFLGIACAVALNLNSGEKSSTATESNRTPPETVSDQSKEKRAEDSIGNSAESAKSNETTEEPAQTPVASTPSEPLHRKKPKRNQRRVIDGPNSYYR